MVAGWPLSWVGRWVLVVVVVAKRAVAVGFVAAGAVVEIVVDVGVVGNWCLGLKLRAELPGRD
jgi:hypothetical protein